MAKESLDEVIEWLQRNPLNRFEIYDLSNDKTITRCIGYQDIKEKHETVKDYFKSLVSNGSTQIQIVKKRKNGSSYLRKCNAGLNFALSTTGSESNVAASSRASENGGSATQQQIPSNNMGTGNYGSFPGLGTPGIGLGLPEIMDMRTNAVRFQETKQELTELKSKYERLLDENKRLEKENWEYKFSQENGPSAVDKLVEGLASNPAGIAALVGAFKSNGPGLAQPAQKQEQNLSSSKAMLVELVSSNPDITDEHVNLAAHAIVQTASGNEDFYNAYIKLLRDHKIIE